MAAMKKLEQVIACPGCDAVGWIARKSKPPIECPMCEERGMLVVDSNATMALPKRPKPVPTAPHRRSAADKKRMTRIIDNGSNPLVVVSPDEVIEWLRQKADEAGFADRESCAVQAAFREGEKPVVVHMPPELTIMVSNIKGSRIIAGQEAGEARRGTAALPNPPDTDSCSPQGCVPVCEQEIGRLR